MSDELTPDEREEFEERAAIIEFDGKEPRTVAEYLARQIILTNSRKRAIIDPEQT